MCQFLIDLDTQLLPDSLNYLLLWLGLIGAALGWTGVSLGMAVWGAVFGYLSLWAVYHLFRLATGKEGMGYGDFKLLAALGAWLGADYLVAIILVSSLVGSVLGLALLVVGKLAHKDIPISFGPFLAGAGLVCLVLGPDAVQAGDPVRLSVRPPVKARRPMLRIGLTGGIGSGKSTVASLLVAQGAVLVDTDAIARQITLAGGAALAPVAAAFGASMIGPDGGLDRERMRERVFGDADAKRRLEAILHPLIGIECERQAALATQAPAIVFDVPLLVESRRWRERVDRVLVVDATEASQVQRVVARSGWTPEAVGLVIAQQAQRPARRAAADAVIFNEHLTLAELAEEVRHLWQHWTSPHAR